MENKPTHPVQAIIARATAPKIAQAVGVSPGHVRMWKLRKRIPPEHWAIIAENELATLQELADAARVAA